MLFLNPPTTSADVRAFCRTFNEGIRVEYKSVFDESVRRALPKVLSSFANSLGGVLIIGVNAPNGVPQQPVQGFPTLAEEVTLTIESSCLQNIHPPITPRIHVIPSDVANHSFVVVEVDESWEAPHALENSTKVYVRTGGAANPYQLSNVDLIIELVRRKAEPTARREYLLTKARDRAQPVVAETAVHVEVSISPAYPRRQLCTREQTWDFAINRTHRGARYFPAATVRRVDDGVASLDWATQYGQLSAEGIIMLRRVMATQENTIFLGEFFNPTLKMLHAAAAFYREFGYKGDVQIEVHGRNIGHRSIPFLAGRPLAAGDTRFECCQNHVSASHTTSSERLNERLTETTQDLMREMCWSFWQSDEAYPSERLDRYLADTIREMNVAGR